MIKTYLIDFDDTIVETGHLHQRAFEETIKKYVIERKRFNYAEWAGRTTKEVISSYVNDSRLQEQATKYKKERYLNLIQNGEVSFLPGFVEFQKYLNKNKLNWGIVSGGSRATVERICVALNIRPTLGIVCAEDYLNGKPSPDPYLRALTDWHLMPSDCLAIEDNKNGMLSAHKAGLQCLIINEKMDQNEFQMLYKNWFDIMRYLTQRT